MFIVNEQIQVNESFYNNPYTHIIKTQNINQENYELKILDSSYTKVIKELLKDKGLEDGISIGCEFAISNGMTIKGKDACVFINAIDDELYKKFGIDIDSKNVAYGFDKNITGEIILEVPVVEEIDLAMIINEDVDFNLHIKLLEDKQKIFLDDDDYNLYIHSEEILDIIDIYFLIENSRDCLNINKNFKNLDKKEKYKLYVNMPLGHP
jgi:hypothetical protein